MIKWSHLPDVRELMPSLRFLHHSPNGGKRDAFTGAQMKALGVKTGFPDLILPVKCNCTFTGLVIEMKSDIGRTSDKQDEWLDHFKAQGWQTNVCRSAEEARQVICTYFGLDPESAPQLE